MMLGLSSADGGMTASLISAPERRSVIALSPPVQTMVSDTSSSSAFPGFSLGFAILGEAFASVAVFVIQPLA